MSSRFQSKDALEKNGQNFERAVDSLLRQENLQLDDMFRQEKQRLEEEKVKIQREEDQEAITEALREIDLSFHEEKKVEHVVPDELSYGALIALKAWDNK